MKVIINIFNLSDKQLRLLQIFFDNLSAGYNVKMLIYMHEALLLVKTFKIQATYLRTLDIGSIICECLC